MSEQKSILQIFKDQRTAKNNLDVQEARRLVNLYRSLSCFGPTFIEQYNQMLLASKPGVRRLFGTFTGGMEVADYLEFLQQNVTPSSKESQQNSTASTSKKGYLPEPSEDLVSGRSEKVNTDRELERLDEQQKILMEQMQRLLERVSTGETAKTAIPSSDNYSEIVEENVETKGR